VSSESAAAAWHTQGRAVVRDSLVVGLAIGSYGVSFGALSVSLGVSELQSCALSVLAFTGGSQFAFIGVVGAGGSPWSGALTGLLLGVRNGLYGLRLAPLLALRGPAQRLVGAHLVIDETTAMAVSHDDPDDPRPARLAFWATGLAIFSMWNLTTLLGAVSVSALGDPARWGLDAAAPAAFLALLWPRLDTPVTRFVAVGGAAVALLLTPFVTPGIPVLAAGLVAVVVGLRQVSAGEAVR
jgi:predicted branched-subunit amino acid permease